MWRPSTVSDGFSDPDPAPSVGDMSGFEDLEALVTDRDAADEMALVDADASCKKCAHYPVCGLYTGIQPMLDQWHTETDGAAETPIEPTKLAWICSAYDPEPE